MELKKIIENFTKINNQLIVNFDLKNQALEIGQELFMHQLTSAERHS